MWCLQESNQGHMDFQSIALPTELRHHSHECGCKYSCIFIIPKKNIIKKCFCKFTPFIRRMNLIIDIGNTFVKFAIFADYELLFKQSVSNDEAEVVLKKIVEVNPKLKRGIISTVGKQNKELINILKKHVDLLRLNSKTKIPFKNKYSTPKTLGVDRIALVSGSVDKFSKNNVLIIDAGTCITYDFINKKNHYLGGAISPGIRLRYHSLHNLTANLPLLEPEYPVDIIGDSTEQSIHSGVINGVLKEIDGVIDEYLEKYEDLTVILTGGDADFLSKRLKNSIFANSNFLLEGLNFILEYNAH